MNKGNEEIVKRFVDAVENVVVAGGSVVGSVEANGYSEVGNLFVNDIDTDDDGSITICTVDGREIVLSGWDNVTWDDMIFSFQFGNMIRDFDFAA